MQFVLNIALTLTCLGITQSPWQNWFVGVRAAVWIISRLREGKVESVPRTCPASHSFHRHVFVMTLWVKCNFYRQRRKKARKGGSKKRELFKEIFHQPGSMLDPRDTKMDKRHVYNLEIYPPV